MVAEPGPAASPAPEMLLSLVADQMPYSIVVVDRDLRLLRWNPAFVELMHEHLGANVENFVAGALFTSLAEGQEERVARWFSVALRGESVAALARAIPRHDGRMAYVDFSLTPLLQDGEVTSILLLMNDATDQVAEESERAERDARTRDSERELRALLAAMTDAVAIIDREGKFLRVVRTGTKMIDTSQADSYIGMGLYDMCPPERADQLLALLREVLDTQDTRTIEYDQALEGTVYWLKATISPINEDTVLWVARDATEDHAHETIIRDSERELRALFAAMKDAVVAIDRNGTFLRVAPTTTSMIDSRYPERYVGTTVYDLFSPRRAAEMLEHLHEVLRTQDKKTIEYRQQIDGRQLWINATISPINAETVLWVARDITEEQEQRERSAETAAMFENIFNQVADGVMVTDMETLKLVEVNPAVCRMHGYTREEFVGMSPVGPESFIHPDSLDKFAAFAAAINEGREYRTRARDLRKDGTAFDIEVTGRPLQIRGRLHVLAVVRDVSEEVRAVELLERRVQERTTELATLLDVSRRVSSRLELDSVLQVILDQVAHVVPYAGASMSMVEGDDIIILQSRGGNGKVREPETEGVRLAGALRGEIGDAVRRGEAIGTPDVRADNMYGNRFRELLGASIDAGPFRYVVSQQMIPLRARGKLIGVMTISRDHRDAFSSHEIELVLTFAGHAGVALDNARLLSESEHRAEQLSTLLEMARVIASTVDLDELFTVVIDQLKRVIDFSHASIVGKYGDEMRLLTRRGKLPDLDIDPGDASIVLRPGRDLIARLSQGQPVVSADVRGEDEGALFYREMTGKWFDRVFTHVRSWAAAPLLRAGELVGYMSVSRSEPGAFSAEDAALVTAFANQVSVAMANANLFAQLDRRTTELATLLETTRAVASIVDLDALAETVLTQLERVVDYATARITLYQGGEFRILARRGPIREGMGDHRTWHVPASPWFISRLREGRMILARDIHDDSEEARLYRETAGQLFTVASETGSWMAAPLPGRQDLLGYVSVTKDTTSAFEDRDWQLVSAFANQVAAAIENAYLLREVEQRAAEISALYRADAELHRSLELDDVLQSLVDVASEVMAVDSSILGIRHPRTGEMRIRGFYGMTRETMEKIQQRFKYMTLQPSERGEVVIYEDAARAGIDSEILRLSRAFSILAVPVQAGPTGFGIFYAGFSQPHTFDAQEIRQHRAIAERAGIAIQNARLYEETQRRARETGALARIATSINFEWPLADALNEIARVAVEATNVVACAVLVMENERVRMSGQFGHSDEAAAVFYKLDEAGINRPMFAAIQQQQPMMQEGARKFLLSVPEFAELHPHIEDAAWEGMVAIPMSARGFPLGTVNFFYAQGDMPGQEDLEFLQAIAAQTAVAIDNARLYEEAQRRARANAALARVASSLMYNRPVQEVINGLAEDALAGTEAVGCAITFFDSGMNTDARLRDIGIIGTCGLPEGYADGMMESWRIGGVPAMREAFMKSGLAIIPDAQRRLRTDPSLAPLSHLAGDIEFDCVANIPLYYRDRPNGAVSFYYRRPEQVDEEEQEYLAALAGQVAIALENVRLFTQTEARAREMEALYSADHEIFQSLDLDTVLEALIRVSLEFLGADKGVVLVWDPDLGRLEARAAHGISGFTMAALPHALGPFPLEAISQTFIIGPGREDKTALGPLLANEGIVSGIRLPIRAGDRLVGTFGLAYTREHEFSDEELRVLQALTDRAAVAIANAELYQRSQQVASLEERQRLARELHDSVSQALYGIALGAKTARTLLDRDAARAVEPMDYVLSLAEAGLAEMRALIFELRPESLQTEGLIAAIEKQVAATRARYGIAVVTDYCAEPDANLAVKEAFFRIAQEALHNTVKHARASEVQITLQFEGSLMSVSVTDNGLGFEPGGEFPGHLGLKSMRERIEKLGGTLSISSTPGSGTTIRAETILWPRQQGTRE